MCSGAGNPEDRVIMKATIVVFLSLVLTVSLTVAKILPYEEDDLSRSEDSMETDTNDHVSWPEAYFLYIFYTLCWR